MAEGDSDAELLARARQQDQAAVAELYARHRGAARRLATTYSRAGDADDLVDEAFFRILGAIERGAGPQEAFRAYLFVTVRRVAMETIARARDEPVAEVPEPVVAEARSPVLDLADREIILTAYGSLPSRHQAVLWQTTVEGRPPRELAPVFGLSANAVAAIASRARDKLREAYLQAHVATTPHPECEPHRSRLGAFVRDGLGRRDRTATEVHLGECASCSDLVRELADVNTLLVRSLVPIFAGASKAGLVVAATAAGGAAAGGGVGGGVIGGAAAVTRRVLSKARTNPAAATVASVVVGAGLVLALVSGRGDDETRPAPQDAAPVESSDRSTTTERPPLATATPPTRPAATTTSAPPRPTTAPQEPPSTTGPASPPATPGALSETTTTTAVAPSAPPDEPLPGAIQASAPSTVPPQRPEVTPSSTVPRRPETTIGSAP